MTDDLLDGFAPPPFKADAALLQIKRSARDLKLSEHGAGFELRGKPILELELDGAVIRVRIARKLALTPQWDTVTVASSGAQRKLLDELKKRLSTWDQED